MHQRDRITQVETQPWGGRTCIMANDELFRIMKSVYMQVDNAESVRLYLSSLSQISDKSLESRKKELRNVLNTRKRELSL